MEYIMVDRDRGLKRREMERLLTKGTRYYKSWRCRKE